MSGGDTFPQFMDGLKSELRKQIGPHVRDLKSTQSMASRADLYYYEGSGGSGGNRDKKKKDNKGKVHAVEDTSSSELLAIEQKKLKDVRKQRKGEQKRLKKLKKSSGQGNKGKTGRTCNWCGKEGHFVKDCPVVQKLKDMANAPGGSSGNA